MNKTKLIVIGVSSYLLFMLFFTPAAWWLKWVTLPPAVQLGNASGTLWQGELSGVRYQQLQFASVRWTFKPLALVTGKLQFSVQSGNAQQPAIPYVNTVASYSFGGAQLQNSIVKLPVAQVLPMVPLPMPVDATGELVLDIAQFNQGKPWCKALGGNVSWQDARLQTPTGTWLDLKSLFGTLSCDNGTVVLTTDGANLLGLDIKAVINSEQLLVNGTLKPDVSMPKEVHQAMQFLGRPDSQGRYPIRF